MHYCYFLQAFPRISETFISDEIYSLLTAGNKVTLVTLYPTDAPLIHENARYVIEHCDLFLLEQTSRSTIIKNVLKALIKHPIRISRSIFRITKLDTPQWINAQLTQLLTKNLEKIDHIHAHFADTQILYAKSFATWLGVDFSFTVHGYDLREFPIGKENLLRTAASAKNIVAYSKSMISILESEGVTKGKASLIPCGINTKKFGEHSNIYTGPPLNIICIARLHPIKGHDIIIKAAKILIDEGLEIRIKLIGDGELRPQLEDLVNKLSIQHNISFLGACEQSVVVNNLLQSHVHILASHHEGLGIANLEAMAMGKAVIGTKVGGLAEVIENDSNGILIPPNNPTELANAIRRIYYSPDFWKKIAENARVFCADNYSIDRQTRKLIELFTS